MKPKMIWALIFVVALCVTLIALLVTFLAFGLPVLFSIGISVIIFVTILTSIIVKSCRIVPQNWEFITEIFGQYTGQPLKPGLHLLTPFGAEIVREEVFMGEMKMELYLDEEVKEGYGGGDVEFKDCSSSLVAFFYFKIFDSAKAAYSVKGIISAIEEKADGVLREFLGAYTLDEAISLKSFFSVKAIACLLSGEDCKKPISDDLYRESEFYRILFGWGIEPLSFTISDINIPERIQQQRERKLTAEKDNEVSALNKIKAETEKDISIIKARAEKEVIEMKGKGEAEACSIVIKRMSEELKAAGVQPEDIAQVITDFKKWEAISKSGSALIVESGADNWSSSGAKFAAGMNLKNEKE